MTEERREGGVTEEDTSHTAITNTTCGYSSPNAPSTPSKTSRMEVRRGWGSQTCGSAAATPSAATTLTSRRHWTRPPSASSTRAAPTRARASRRRRCTPRLASLPNSRRPPAVKSTSANGSCSSLGSRELKLEVGPTAFSALSRARSPDLSRSLGPSFPRSLSSHSHARFDRLFDISRFPSLLSLSLLSRFPALSRSLALSLCVISLPPLCSCSRALPLSQLSRTPPTDTLALARALSRSV